MGGVKFQSWGKELEDIKSRGVKKIVREVDSVNPVFKRIEEMNGRHANGYPYGCIGITEDNGLVLHERIKKISYKDGDVIIEW